MTKPTGGEPPDRKPEEPKSFPIHIDNKQYMVTADHMTGAQLRLLPTPPIGPDRDLFRVVPGVADDQKVGDNETVELKPGMHFYPAPKTINPGRGLGLLESDENYLKEKGMAWEIVPNGGDSCLIIKGFPVTPQRYDRDRTDLMIRIPPNYNQAALDMFYVDPPVKLKSGGYAQSSEVFEVHGGRRWQRFSRHLNTTPWRSGIDALPMYLALIAGELQRGG